jgi:hypothetical protein
MHESQEKNQEKNFVGAIEGTRTPTPLPVHGPEPCASANSATMAILGLQCSGGRKAAVSEDISILQTHSHLSNQQLAFLRATS